MSEEQDNKVFYLCYKNLDKFTNIYENGNEVNPIPENVKITIYCEHNEYDGFVFNTTSDKLGIQSLIAEKWILHSELEEITGLKID